MDSVGQKIDSFRHCLLLPSCFHRKCYGRTKQQQIEIIFLLCHNVATTTGRNKLCRFIVADAYLLYGDRVQPSCSWGLRGPFLCISGIPAQDWAPRALGALAWLSLIPEMDPHQSSEQISGSRESWSFLLPEMQHRLQRACLWKQRTLTFPTSRDVP